MLLNKDVPILLHMHFFMVASTIIWVQTDIL